MTDLVSVVVPTRDRRVLLERTLRTVLWQSHTDLEVIVVDDGSTDDTADFVAGIDDPRVQLVRLPASVGVAAARNRGLAAATGTHVAFLDDDDVWAPDKVRRQLDAMRGAPAALWCYPAAVIVDERLRPMKWQAAPPTEGLVTRLLQVNVIPGGASSVMARRETVVDAGGFDATLATFADRDLWIRLGLAGPAARVDEVLVAYVRHGRSMTTDVARKYHELAALEEKYRALRAETNAVAPDVAVLHSIAETAWRAGDVRAARQTYLAATLLPQDRLSRLRWLLTFVPRFMALYDTGKRLRLPRSVRSQVEWLSRLSEG